jgi:hypothetical protein
MLTLTEEQRQALRDHPGKPVRLVDAATQEAFVLLPAALYDRLQALLDAGEADLDVTQVALLVEEAMSEDDAGDPTLAFYQEQYGRAP